MTIRYEYLMPYIIVYEMSVPDRMTWNHTTVYILFVFDENVSYHITMCWKIIEKKNEI